MGRALLDRPMDKQQARKELLGVGTRCFSGRVRRIFSAAISTQVTIRESSAAPLASAVTAAASRGRAGPPSSHHAASGQPLRFAVARPAVLPRRTASLPALRSVPRGPARPRGLNPHRHLSRHRTCCQRLLPGAAALVVLGRAAPLNRSRGPRMTLYNKYFGYFRSCRCATVSVGPTHEARWRAGPG